MSVIFCDEFSTKNLTFTEYQNSGGGIQNNIFINYKDSNLIFQTDFIRITRYGIQNLGHYYKQDQDRSFVKVALDYDQQSCQELREFLSALQEHIQKHQDVILGKYSKLYELRPLIKTPIHQLDDDDDDDDDEGERKRTVKKLRNKERERKPDYCILKFKKKPSGELATSFFLNKNDEITRLAIKTMTDLQQVLTWNSSFRAIVHVNKIWFNKNKQHGAENRDYGVSFKILQMEIKPYERNNLDTVFNEYQFKDKNEVIEIFEGFDRDYPNQKDNSKESKSDKKDLKDDNEESDEEEEVDCMELKFCKKSSKKNMSEKDEEE